MQVRFNRAQTYLIHMRLRETQRAKYTTECIQMKINGTIRESRYLSFCHSVCAWRREESTTAHTVHTHTHIIQEDRYIHDTVEQTPTAVQLMSVGI